MTVYILTMTTHMGMDGDYTQLIGAYRNYEDAEKDLDKFVANERDGQHSYDFDMYEIEELYLK